MTASVGDTRGGGGVDGGGVVRTACKWGIIGGSLGGYCGFDSRRRQVFPAGIVLRVKEDTRFKCLIYE